MSKCDIFYNELNLIEDIELKNIIKNVLNAVPDYFYHIAASSTGKYHPDYCLGEGGLVRHTKAAVKIAECLLQLDMYKAFLPIKDLIFSALILHDTIKKGLNGNQYTTFDHPLDAADYFEEIAKKSGYTHQNVKIIADMIRSHMGQWNTTKYSKTVLPLPKTKAEKFVHQCDYLASRKFITITDID